MGSISLEGGERGGLSRVSQQLQSYQLQPGTNISRRSLKLNIFKIFNLQQEETRSIGPVAVEEEVKGSWSVYFE